MALNIRREVRLKVAERRLSANERLWAATDVTSPSGEPLDEQGRNALHDELTLIWNQAHLLRALRERERHYKPSSAPSGHLEFQATMPLPEPIIDPAAITHLHVRPTRSPRPASSTNTSMLPDLGG